MFLVYALFLLSLPTVLSATISSFVLPFSHPIAARPAPAVLYIAGKFLHVFLVHFYNPSHEHNLELVWTEN